MREVRCEGCGDRFRCLVGDDQACWCTKVETSDAARTSLAELSDDCVCPACLADATTVVVDLTSSSDVDA